MSENAVEQKLSLMEKVKFFFTNPKILFERFIEKPKYGINLLIILLTSLISALVSSKFSKDIIKKIMEQQFKSQGAPPQAAEIAKKSADFATNPMFLSITTILGTIVIIFFTSLIIFLILKIAKCSLKYKQVVSIYCLSSISLAIYNIILTLYTLILQKPAINPETQINPTVTSVISSNINIFSIWKYILVGIGIYAVAKTSKKKATILSIICFVLFTGILIGIGLLKVK